MSAREGMQALVDKWRKDADDAPRSQSNEERGYSNALHDVADELAALLASPAQGAAEGSDTPVFDMDAAVEAVAKHIARDFCVSKGYTLDDTLLHIETRWMRYADEAKEVLTAALPFLGASAACDDIQPDMEALRRGHRRYEYVRTLTPRGFRELWDRNMGDEGPFDDLVDAALAAKAGKQGGERQRTDAVASSFGGG